jgi:hypothetical protein
MECMRSMCAGTETVYKGVCTRTHKQNTHHMRAYAHLHTHTNTHLERTHFRGEHADLFFQHLPPRERHVINHRPSNVVSVVTMLLHCRCTIVALLLHYCYTVVTLLSPLKHSR